MKKSIMVLFICGSFHGIFGAETEKPERVQIYKAFAALPNGNSLRGVVQEIRRNNGDKALALLIEKAASVADKRPMSARSAQELEQINEEKKRTALTLYQALYAKETANLKENFLELLGMPMSVKTLVDTALGRV